MNVLNEQYRPNDGDALTHLMFDKQNIFFPGGRQFSPLYQMLPQSSNIQDERSNPVRPRPNAMFELMRKFSPEYGPLSIQAGALSVSKDDPNITMADLIDASDNEKLRQELSRR